MRHRSGPINLGPIVNSSSYDACPTIAKSGLSLYIRSNRPGGQGGFDIYVAQRDSLEDPWSIPSNLGTLVNSTASDFHPTLSWDGTTLIFASERGGAAAGWADLWMSTRSKIRD